MILFEYPHSFYKSYNWTSPYRSYKVEEKDNKIIAEIELPGVDRDKIDVSYQSETGSIRVEVKDGPSFDVLLSRRIDADAITAELDKGVLTIESPILNTDKRIEIK